ncbi:unnamed protein product [Schistosoma curassoni]|uniref:Ras-GEF domain-containing protein n=1 Tax=Schistosoma curassoni TaxID=6186 RepID=A0A183KXQ6_9TREM|nr:unnamed protein product [Schistosoma curassoni]
MSILNHLEVEYPLAMERDGSTEDVSRLTNLIGREIVLQKDSNTPADVNFTDLIKAFYKDSHLNRYPQSILLLYATLEELVLDHIKCTNFECCVGGKFRKTIRQDIKDSTTSLRHPHPMRTQGYADNNSLRSCEAGHEDDHKFDICLSRGKSHSCNSSVFHNAKCSKCDD